MQLTETHEELTQFVLEYSSCANVHHEMLCQAISNKDLSFRLHNNEWNRIHQELVEWLFRVADKWHELISIIEHKYLITVEIQVAGITTIVVMQGSEIVQKLKEAIRD